MIKKILMVLIPFIILSFIAYEGYIYFFKYDTVTSKFDLEFSLSKGQSGVVEGSITAKLIGVDDDRCKGNTCEGEGQMVAKILIINESEISYVKLGTLVDSTASILNDEYTIELLKITDDYKVTLKIIEN